VKSPDEKLQNQKNIPYGDRSLVVVLWRLKRERYHAVPIIR